MAIRKGDSFSLGFSRALWVQAEADLRDANTLLRAGGSACGVLALVQGAGEKFVKACWARSVDRSTYIARLKSIQHQPLSKAPELRRVRELLPSGLRRRLEDLEAMQPRLMAFGRRNPRYPWLDPRTGEPRIPSDEVAVQEVQQYFRAVQGLRRLLDRAGFAPARSRR